MTFSLRALALGALSLGLAACASETDTAEPLEGATDVAEATADIPAGAYALDQPHSELGFRVRHLGIANVDGSFTDFTELGRIMSPLDVARPSWWPRDWRRKSARWRA